MRAAHANRLARWADRRRRDGTRGWRARLAWRILTGALERYDVNASRAIQQAWLRNPSDELWAYVRYMHTPDELELFVAAIDPARDAANRAAIGAFYHGTELRLDDDVKTALFFVLTGQHQQHRALDPDGSLLATGYRGATTGIREALRRALVGTGRLDLVRAIADRPSHVLMGSEADYLAARLADVRDWDRLWRLIPNIRLPDAARFARLFGDWRPADDSGRAFLDRLAGTDPDVIDAVLATELTTIKDVYPHDLALSSGRLSFAPDNSELAVGHQKGVTIFALPGGHQLEHHADSGPFGVLALGKATTVHIAGQPDGRSVTRHSRGRPDEVLLRGQPGTARLARTPGGFVVAESSRLSFGTTEGRWSRVVDLREFLDGPTDGMVSLVDADPVSGNLAIQIVGSGPREIVLLDADLTVLARTRSGPSGEVKFCGPDQLLVWNRGDVRSVETWRRDGTALVQAATVSLDYYYYYYYWEPAPLPARNLVLIPYSHVPVWLDASTLTKATGPPGFPVIHGQPVVFSADGSLAATDTLREVRVYDLTMRQINDLTSLSLAVPADLDTVAALGNQRLIPRARELLELLRLGLEYRFGAEIALGSATRIADADDIALGGR